MEAALPGFFSPSLGFMQPIVPSTRFISRGDRNLHAPVPELSSPFITQFWDFGTFFLSIYLSINTHLIA